MAPSPDRKAEILERLSFESYYLGELHQLKVTTAGNAQARCPFHEDKDPSLSVNYVTGLFKCFGCGAQGDVFKFYQLRHGVSFKEALEALAEIAGVADAPDAPRNSEAAGHKSLKLKEFALAKRLPEDFLLQNRVKEYHFPDGTIATDFHYLSEAGKLLAIRHRFGDKGDKKFRWRKGDRVGLYGLWKWERILEAGYLVLVEGESDCLTLWLHGIPALGLPGKETWRRCRTALGAEKLSMLQDLDVYLWEEPDAGIRPANNPSKVLLRDQVAADLPHLMVIVAPDDFKDISELHTKGHDVRARMVELRRKARPPEPPPVPGHGFSFSDLGNARRLVALHGRDLRYCHLSKKWMRWTGRHWSVDDSGEVERKAKLTVAQMYREAADINSLKEREVLVKWALQSESQKSILAMVRLAQSEPGIPINPNQFDADPWLFNVENGTVDLRTGELRPHDPEDLLTCMAPVRYDPDAECALFEKFIWQIMDVNNRPAVAQDMVEFLQRALGYSLTGDTREQCFFMLWGGGSNGKSTLIELIARIIGSYSCNSSIDTFVVKNRSGEIPMDLARLDGPRLVTSQEVDKGMRLSEALVKKLTGRDMITARFMYADLFDFIPQFKLWISTNNKPQIRGTDNAIWRRIMFVKFHVQIPPEERDGDLPEKLWAERGGILSWLIRGCLQWQMEGLEPPQEVLDATAEYREEMDVLAEFMSTCCILGPAASVSAKDLYQAYCTWADESGLREKEQLKQRMFGILLGERGFQKDKGSGGQRLWRGVGLREG